MSSDKQNADETIVREVTQEAMNKLFAEGAIAMLELYETMRKMFGAEKTLEVAAELHKTAKRLAMDERKSKLWVAN